MMAHKVSVGEAQSVTSNSASDNQDDDDDDSSDDNHIVRRVSNTKITRVDVDKLPVAAASPAPAPTKGNEDDVVRLSHIASIEVKEQKKDPPRSTSPVPENKSRHRRDSKERGYNNHNRATTTPNTRKNNQNENGAEHDSELSDCAPMDVIEKSPYEPMFNAEKGVKLFSDMRSLLAESNNDDYRSVSPKATKIFGPTNAWCLVKANGLIEKSGMVYSQEWVNGNIRGNLIGKIPNDLLLLCFVSKRFVKAGELLLAGLTRDLQVYVIVKEALKAWGLDDEYKRISSCPKNFPFTAKKRDCFKCEIFVARAYSCYKAYCVKEEMDDGLLAKVRTCLDIMESRLPEPGAPKKRKTKMEPKDAPEAAAALEEAPAKRRRGRPPKSTHPTPPEPVRSQELRQENALQKSESVESNDIEVTHRRAPAAQAGASRLRRSNSSSSNGSKRSLTLNQLVSKFEDQYLEMGERYKEMGETLAQLKVKVDENRDKTEQEIRNELLQEVQKTIMSSFPKK